MKRMLKVAGVLAVAVVIVALIGVTLYGGTLIRRGVETVGPKALGVPVTLQRVTFLPFAGRAGLSGLHVGNPAGFNTSGAFDLGMVEVELDTGSLWSGTIHIKRIRVDKPAITYEKGMSGSNLGQVMAGVQAKAGADAGGGQKPARKVVIEELAIDGAKLNVSVTALRGRAATVPLPPIRLTNIGKDSGGATAAEVLSQVLAGLNGSVQATLASSGKVLGEGVELLEGSAGAAATAARERAEKAAERGTKAIDRTLGKAGLKLSAGTLNLTKDLPGGLKKDVKRPAK